MAKLALEVALSSPRQVLLLLLLLGLLRKYYAFIS
jgi:hypothetical protein